MEVSIVKSIEILERTPGALLQMVDGVSEDWTSVNEGEGTWSVYDVIGHLIHAERTDWITRMELILSDIPNKTFHPFDRFAQFQNSKGKSLKQLLIEFQEIRGLNIEKLKRMDITTNRLIATGIHPAFGEVTLSQLLATWVVHDLNHIAQISRVMAKQYLAAVGPWKEYLGILKS